MPTPYEDDVSDWLGGQAELLRLKRFAELDIDRQVAELWARVEEPSHGLRSALMPLLTDPWGWAYRPDWQADNDDDIDGAQRPITVAHDPSMFIPIG
jgi:hypothetical protein